jgi:hypothetical protein
MENVYWSPCKRAFVPFRIRRNLNFMNKFSKNSRMSNFTKIRSVGGELFHADRQTDTNGEANSRLPQFFKGVQEHNGRSFHRRFWFLQHWNVQRLTHDEIWTRFDNVDPRGPITTFYTQFYDIFFQIIRVPCRQLFHNICTKNCMTIRRQYFVNVLQFSCTYRTTPTIFKKAVNKESKVK